MRVLKFFLILGLLVGCQTEPIPTSKSPNKTNFGLADTPSVKPLPQPTPLSVTSDTVLQPVTPPLEINKSPRAKPLN